MHVIYYLSFRSYNTFIINPVPEREHPNHLTIQLMGQRTDLRLVAEVSRREVRRLKPAEWESEKRANCVMVDDMSRSHPTS